MTEALLIRTETSDRGTRGLLRAGDYTLHSIELPWRDNQRGISCIPTGRYPAQLIYAGKFGYVYWVHPVPGRSEILIHTGAWAGDKSLGYRTHSAGCILLGMKCGVANGQDCVLLTRPAIERLRDAMRGKPFYLTIEEHYDAGTAGDGIQ